MLLTKLFKGLLAVSFFYAGIAGSAAIAAPEGQSLVQAVAPKTSQLTEEEIQKTLASLKYDNPRNSPDYDRGYEEGMRRRNAAGTGKSSVSSP